MRMAYFRKEALNYRLAVDILPVDVSYTKGITVSYGPILTMPEHQAWNKEVTTHMYGLQLLQLWIGRCLSTQEEI